MKELNCREFLFLIVGSICALLSGTQHVSGVGRDATKPNIVFLFVDDFSPGDVSCYGGDLLETPNIDRIATEGARFDSFYVPAPICSAARAGIMTGKFPSRVNIPSALFSSAGPEPPRKTSYVNIGEGKKIPMHLWNKEQGNAEWLDSKHNTIPKILKTVGYKTAHYGKWHLGKGYGVPEVSEYGYDDVFIQYGQKAKNNKKSKGQFPREKSSAGLLGKTLDFLKANRNSPCFVNLWFNDTHSPYIPDEKAYQEILAKNTKPLNEKRKRELKFLAVLDQFDKAIGVFLDQLKEEGLESNTLLILAGDNGAAAPLFKTKRTLGRRGQKFSLYEGGIWAPFLARWPGHIPKGTVNKKTVLHGVDLLPMFAALTGARLDSPEQYDGEDLSGIFFGKAPVRKKRMFWEYGRNDSYFYPLMGRQRSPNIAVREGGWKLLVNEDESRAELYNIEKDPMEKKNLYASNKELGESLKKLALDWRKSLPPRPEPGYPTKLPE